MNKLVHSVAKGAFAAGTLTGASAWSIDLATCPGEVETSDGEIFYAVCDENPGSDDYINTPGTAEQKIAYVSFVVAAVGGVALLRLKEPAQTQTASPTTPA